MNQSAVGMKAAIVALALVSRPAAAAPETPLGFVSLYLHEIAEIDRYRAEAAKNQTTNPKDMAACVHDAEAWALELEAASRALAPMNLPANNMSREAPQLTSKSFDTKARIINAIGEGCGTFIGGPHDGVDYGAVAARMPKMRADLESVDRTLFVEGNNLVFATLLSGKPDSQGYGSFLSISREQRNGLIELIRSEYGDALNEPNQGWAVETGKFFITKMNEFHVSDER